MLSVYVTTYVWSWTILLRLPG